MCVKFILNMKTLASQFKMRQFIAILIALTFIILFIFCTVEPFQGLHEDLVLGVLGVWGEVGLRGWAARPLFFQRPGFLSLESGCFEFSFNGVNTLPLVSAD